MKQIMYIASAEWRYWFRSYLAIGSAIVFLILVITTSIITSLRIDSENTLRTHQQALSEKTFLEQPDRHPHRMVHYGHYVFRAPAPLAVFDPGLDTVTGQSIFLEGHRQNTAMFTESEASADLGGISLLTPAMIYQLFAPLVIILLGYSSLARERESKVLTQVLALGISGNKVVAGKTLALFSFTLLLLLPLVLNGLTALFDGENILAVAGLFFVYLVYLVIWIGLTIFFSVFLRKRSSILAVLTGLWFILTLVLPSVAVNIATSTDPLSGKIATDLAMLTDLRKHGDGHNANDPAFQQLRNDLLKEYGVDHIEDLPINFRGIVSYDAEEKQTDVLNQYAKTRMAGEIQQVEHIEKYGTLSPTIAIAFVSRSIAGTNLAHYHRFQKDAEELRYSFVQGLNRAHSEKLSYQDDINRNKDEDSWQRARIESSNWKVLDSYQFNVSHLSERFKQAFFSLAILLVWLLLIFFALIISGRRLRP